MASSPDTGVRQASSVAWQAPNEPEFWSVVAHADALYARTAAGIVRWDDGERQWRSVRKNPFDRYCMGLAAGPASTAPIYALEANFLFVSYDNCRSWARRPMPFKAVPQTQTPIAADPTQPFTVYVFGQTLAGAGPDWKAQYGLYWSHDAGRTWDGPLLAGPVSAPFGPAQHSLIVLAPDPSFHLSGGIFMAAAHGVYQWTGVPFSGAQVTPLLELPPDGRRAIDALAVGPHAKNPLAVVARIGDAHHVQVSLDRGASWTVRDPYPHKFLVDDLLYVDDLLFLKGLHWDPAQGGKLLGVILMSRDNGASWIDVTAPDLAVPLARQTPIDWPREGLAASSTHLYLMSRTIGERSVALSALRALPG